MFVSIILWLTLLIIILFIIYALIYLKNRKFNQLFGKIPGPPAYPLIGNLNLLLSNSCVTEVNPHDQIITALSVIYSEQGLFKMMNGPVPQVMIYRDDLAKEFLKNNSNLEKPFEYQLLSGWLGKGLLINDNTSLWRHRRKLLTPTFHLKIIENFVPVINETSNVLIKKLKGCVGKESFNLEPLLFSCSLDTLAVTTLGVELNCQQNKNLNYFEAVQRMIENFFKRLKQPWLYWDFLFYLTKTGKEFKSDLKILHGLTRKVINERKESLLVDKQNTDLEISDKKRKRLALLDLLLDIHLKDNSLSLEDIREEVDTFMFAGHETSASSLMWTFYLLGLNPDIQQRLYEELDSIVSDKENITMDDIKQFTYLEAVIKESLRIYPPGPLVIRKITEDLKLGEYVVPKGVSLYLLIYRLQMDPKVFSEPLLFRPERFLEKCQSGNDFNDSFTPFSAGPRQCIGQKFALNELKIIIAKVILNYCLESLEDRNDIFVFNGIVSKPVNGIQMKIKLRL